MRSRRLKTLLSTSLTSTVHHYPVHFYEKDMSYKPEVQTDDSGTWYANSLCFDTREEATAYTQELGMKWMKVRAVRVVKSDDPVSHVYVDGSLKEIANL